MSRPPEAVRHEPVISNAGGKNWILPKEINAKRFFWDFHWLEISKSHPCPSMGPNGGSVAMDSDLWILFCDRKRQPENRGSFIYTCQNRTARSMCKSLCPDRGTLCRKTAAPFFIPAKTGQPACSMCMSLWPDRWMLCQNTAAPFSGLKWSKDNCVHILLVSIKFV